MMWTIVWSDVTTHDVRRIPWPIAARACAAVIEFADTGRGHVERVSPHDPWVLRVRARGASALIRLDVPAQTLFVWRIYATSS